MIPVDACTTLYFMGILILFFIFYLFIFRQRGREGEREGEKHQWAVVSHAPPTGDLACNPGMCPDWELNWRPFASQASTQPTEPHQLRLFYCYFRIYSSYLQNSVCCKTACRYPSPSLTHLIFNHVS